MSFLDELEPLKQSALAELQAAPDLAALDQAKGQWLGAQAGSHMVITRGTKFIRPVFLTMVVLITLKMIYDNYFKAAV